MIAVAQASSKSSRRGHYNASTKWLEAPVFRHRT